ILWPIENRYRPFERVRIARTFEKLLAELLRDDTGLHDGRVKQGTTEMAEPSVGLERIRVFTDDAAVPGMLPRDILRDGFSVAGQRVPMEFTSVEELGHHGGQTPCSVVFLAEIFTCRLHVDQQGDVKAMRI